MHYTFVQKNGLRVVFIPRKESKICSINVHVDAGSICDEKSFPLGTSHFVEHMIFNGSKKYPNREDLLGIILDKGGKRGAYTSYFEQQHFVTISKQYLQAGLDYLSQTLLYPSFTEEAFFKEKQVILAELAKNESSFERVFYTKGVNKTIFASKALHNYPLGNKNSLENITFKDVISFHAQFFNPNRMTLFISGDYSKETVVELCNTYFAKDNLINGLEKETFERLELNTPRVSKLTGINSKNVKIAYAQFLQKETGYHYLSMLFLMQILCVGEASRLFKELREVRKLVYDVHPNNLCTPYGFLIGIVTQASKEHTEEIKKVILSEIKNIAVNSIKKEELMKVKNKYRQKVIEGCDSTKDVCDMYYRHFKKFGSLYNFKQEQQQIELVTSQDIKDSAKLLLKNDISWIEMSC